MNFNDRSEQVVDAQLQEFVEKQTQLSRFRFVIFGLTDKCWDICMGKVYDHLDTKTTNCLSNCVERFIETTKFIVNRLDKTVSSSSSSFD